MLSADGDVTLTFVIGLRNDPSLISGLLSAKVVIAGIPETVNAGDFVFEIRGSMDPVVTGVSMTLARVTDDGGTCG